MSKTDDRYSTATDGRSLRNVLMNCSASSASPFLFVLSELKSSLLSSIPHWDAENVANGMAVNRMNTLLGAVEEVAFSKTRLPWLQLSSLLFGTCMVHKVIDEQAREGYKFCDNAWFAAFLYNFGEVCDRVKLYALLEDNG